MNTDTKELQVLFDDYDRRYTSKGRKSLRISVVPEHRWYRLQRLNDASDWEDAGDIYEEDHLRFLVPQLRNRLDHTRFRGLRIVEHLSVWRPTKYAVKFDKIDLIPDLWLTAP